jgi:ABC-type lipoprotein release transport system permease subunit
MTGMLRLLLPIAWRNLWRNPRRTLITLVVVAIGMWSILVFTIFLKAWALGARNETLRLLTGEGQIHAIGYLDDPDVNHRMRSPAGKLLAMLDHAPVVVWTPRVRIPAVIESEYRAVPITALGVLPAGERKISDLPGELENGRYLAGGADGSIVLGSHLVSRLKTRLGKRVIIMAQAADGRLAERSFTVVGAFGGAQGVQDQFAFTGIRSLQQMLGIGSDISEISFDVAADNALDPTIAALRRAAPDLDIEPWMQFSPMSYAMDRISGTYVGIWLAIMFVLMAIGIVNTQLMAVFERTREFGLLQALGMKPRLILLQVALESAILIAVGVAIGTGLTAASVLPFANGIDLGVFAAGVERFGGGRMLYPKLDAADIVRLTLIVWIMGIVAALWPARRASLGNPVDAMGRG